MLKRADARSRSAGKRVPEGAAAGARHHERNHRRERRLWHDPERSTDSLGCRACPDFGVCGGLRLAASLFDCLQFCCGRPESCDRVCRKHPDFPDRVREVGGFELATVRRGPVLPAPELPRMVPMIFHRSGLRAPPAATAVALSLYSMFDRRDGAPRFSDHEALCAAKGLAPGTKIVLSGTHRDPPLERWWGLGGPLRLEIIRAMKAAGISLVTTPNYSLFTNRPRQDDLHAMMRIAHVHEEFLRGGLPAALHVNGRTEKDFERWAAYIAGRPEVTHVAYEFTTGTAWAGRQEQHAAWLAELAAAVSRPLRLVVRGSVDVYPTLARAFAGITVLETSIFMKTIKRQRAYPKSNVALGWRPAPTAPNAALDDLLADNQRTVDAWIRDLMALPAEGVSAAP